MLPVPTKNSAPSVSTRALTTPFTDTQLTTIKKRPPLWMKTSEQTTKWQTRIPRMQQTMLPDDIGKYVVRDVESVTRLGWTEFVHWQRGRGDFASMSEIEHPARRLLRQYKHRGAPVVLMTGGWSEGERLAALKRGPHKSATKHAPFSPQKNLLDDGEGAVGGATLLGGQEATGTQVEPAQHKGGTG